MEGKGRPHADTFATADCLRLRGAPRITRPDRQLAYQDTRGTKLYTKAIKESCAHSLGYPYYLDYLMNHVLHVLSHENPAARLSGLMVTWQLVHHLPPDYLLHWAPIIIRGGMLLVTVMRKGAGGFFGG